MKRKILLFLSGALCFIISQPLLRIPLLNILSSNTDFILFLTLNTLISGILIAFSAGIFEESFRFLFRRFLFNMEAKSISSPIIFGIGHGIAEALFILLPVLSIVSLKDLYLGILERILAIILHVGLTVVIWNGFQKNKKYKYLAYAILFHGLVNSMIPIFAPVKNGLLLIEIILAVLDVFVIVYIVNSRKYYVKETKNEANKMH